MDSITGKKAVIIWSCILLVGVIFKLLHWPGTVLILICSPVLTACAVGGLIILKEKTVLNMAFTIAGTMWFLMLLWGNIFNGGYPYNWNAFAIYSIVFLICLLIYVLIKIRRNKKANANSPLI